MPETHDLCLAWNWPYDAQFIALLDQACQARGLSLLQVTPENLEAFLAAVDEGRLVSRAYLDRASDSEQRFLALTRQARQLGWFRINPRERETRAADKATMHLEFISAGLQTPYTIILSSYDEQPDLPPLDLRPLGESFAIKPANGGGGDGVITEATSLQQVALARQQFSDDKYLLQAHIVPVELDGRPAWFRVIYCTGQIYPCWWDPQVRIYQPISAEEMQRHGLAELLEVTATIARISRLHLFSTEIALVGDGRFMIIDYVNDQIDLRLRSHALDGVPDDIVVDIAGRLADLVLLASARAHETSQQPFILKQEETKSVTDSTVPLRSEIAPHFTWNAPSVFPSTEAWEAEFEAIRAGLPAIRSLESQLGQGASALAGAMDAIERLMGRLGRLQVYASISQAVDTTDQEATQMVDKARGLYGQTLAAISFLEPELLHIGQETLGRWLDEEPRLAIYRHYLDDLFRKQAHVRSQEVEEVLGLAADPFSSVYSTFSMLTNADFRFRPAEASDGRNLALTQSTYQGILNGSDQQARRTAWENYADSYLAYKNTLTTNLLTSIKQRVFRMRVRRHESTLAMTLFEDNIPVEVFDNLIETFRKNLPTWHRYWAIRRRALGVETLHSHDIWAPLTDNPPRISYQQAVDWICQGLTPLGQNYVDTVRRGCQEERWIDVYPNQGKAEGAFSSGSKGTYPFILMSFTDDVNSLGTLAHELGHSMHSFLTWQNQPVIYSDYSSFVAEVASNFHQALVRAHLLAQNPAPALQIALIEEAMTNFHRYFLVMPTLARFELELHQRIEQGKGITSEGAIDLMADLLAEGYGDEMQMDRQRDGIQWATFPHLYAGYYVFQYATGISGAHALANRVLSGAAGAVDDYLSFLKTGSSMYPLDALKMAGVDLTKPEPVEETFQVLAGLVDRLDELTSSFG